MSDADSASFIPAFPPPEVLEEIDAAWLRSAGLAGEDLSVHVRVGTITGRISGELRVEGAVLERLSPSQILALACGDPLALPRRRY